MASLLRASFRKEKLGHGRYMDRFLPYDEFFYPVTGQQA
jgi:hypothetical protein